MAFWDDDIGAPRPLPTTVVGITWVLAGLIGLVLSLLWLSIAINLAGMTAPVFMAAVLGSLSVGLLAAWLIFIGKRTLKGERIKLLLSGKLSIGFGAALIAGNVWLLVADAPIRTVLNKQFVTILKEVGVSIGLVLVLVGLLAILGRVQDRVWRRSKSGRL